MSTTAATAPIGWDYMPGRLEQTMHWQVIWLRVISTAWEDPDFKQALLADARAAIESKFGYQLSPEMELTVVDDASGVVFDRSKAYYDHSLPPNEQTDPWEGLPPMRLTMTLPPPPPVEDQAVAIAAYGDTARSYPFTCC